MGGPSSIVMRCYLPAPRPTRHNCVQHGEQAYNRTMQYRQVVTARSLVQRNHSTFGAAVALAVAVVGVLTFRSGLQAGFLSDTFIFLEVSRYHSLTWFLGHYR